MQANRSQAADLCHRILDECGTAALATLSSDSAPFASHVSLAWDGSAPILLLSRLAVHTENLGRDPRASLLLVRPASAATDSMAVERLTLVGRVIACTEEEPAKRAFLARHPAAVRYAGFADFGFHRFDIHSGHLVAGFGLILELSRSELLDGASGQHPVGGASRP